jgi:hypothetical protein
MVVDAECGMITPSLKRLGYHRLSLRDRREMTSVGYRRIRPIRRRHHVSINLIPVQPTAAKLVCSSTFKMFRRKTGEGPRTGSREATTDISPAFQGWESLKSRISRILRISNPPRIRPSTKREA